MSLLKSNKYIFSAFLIARNTLVKWFKYKKVKLSYQEQVILNTVKRDGIVVIPHYFSEDQCDELKSIFDKLVVDHSFYCEENEYRVFGMDKLSSRVSEIFSSDKLAWNVCEAYLGEEMYLQTTMSARIEYKEGVKYGSGGSWHRDSFSKQIKSISYLTDMTDENGPFMYIKGSHRLWGLLKVLFKLKRKGCLANLQRYSDEDVDNIMKILGEEITYFPCEKGALVLADIRGLHTTRYLKSGLAYSIFNYYIAKFDHLPSGSIVEVEKKCIEGSALNLN